MNQDGGLVTGLHPHINTCSAIILFRKARDMEGKMDLRYIPYILELFIAVQQVSAGLHSTDTLEKKVCHRDIRTWRWILMIILLTLMVLVVSSYSGQFIDHQWYTVLSIFIMALCVPDIIEKPECVSKGILARRDCAAPFLMKNIDASVSKNS